MKMRTIQSGTPNEKQFIILIKLLSFQFEFRKNVSGTVAILFAQVLVPLVVVAGIGIDYSRAAHVRVQLQAATDAAAMAGALSKLKTDSGRAAVAAAAFDGNIAAVNHGATVQKSATSQTGFVTVVSSAALPTYFMKIVGMNSMQISTTSKVATSGKKLELALVLDTTGSMNRNNKLQSLKAAVPNILDIVMPSGHTGTRVALVPFAAYVNVGANSPSELTGRSDKSNARCVYERRRGGRPNESPPVLYTDEFWVLSSNSDCSSTKPITPLTSSRTVLDDALTGLSASGTTSGHLGIQWGWHAISPLWAARWPTGSEPAAYTDEKTMKAIVMLTDGNFTEFHKRENGTSANCSGSSDCPESRAEAKVYCDLIKSRKDFEGEEAVMVFTIGFSLDPENTSTGAKARDTMKYCASYDKNDPEPNLALRKKHFYFPVTQEDLEAAFTSIGDAVADALKKPRLVN